jgi:hypothetical protein
MSNNTKKPNQHPHLKGTGTSTNTPVVANSVVVADPIIESQVAIAEPVVELDYAMGASEVTETVQTSEEAPTVQEDTQVATTQTVQESEAVVLEKPIIEPVVEQVQTQVLQEPVAINTAPAAVPVPPPAPTVVITSTVTTTNTQVSETSAELSSLVERVKATNDKPSIDVISGFLDYVNLMKPNKPMNEETGIKHQVKLYRMFQFMMNQPLADFNLVMATVLRIVDESKEKGAFADRYAFRFTEHSPLSKNDTDAFVRFMNLLVTISAVNGRKNAIKQVDLNRTLVYGFTDEARQRMLTFTSL